MNFNANENLLTQTFEYEWRTYVYPLWLMRMLNTHLDETFWENHIPYPFALVRNNPEDGMIRFVWKVGWYEMKWALPNDKFWFNNLLDAIGAFPDFPSIQHLADGYQKNDLMCFTHALMTHRNTMQPKVIQWSESMIPVSILSATVSNKLSAVLRHDHIQEEPWLKIYRSYCTPWEYGQLSQQVNTQEHTQKIRELLLWIMARTCASSSVPSTTP